MFEDPHCQLGFAYEAIDQDPFYAASTQSLPTSQQYMRHSRSKAFSVGSNEDLEDLMERN
jgi:hypothetical protein